ncbi:hypothetical protein JAAARDRAFT_168979 [Jaapia argillacea MUCL 33604]|uniref:NAD-dependent epimerase/dehydratase domain-containing protein n=1 Tax=Jaapia argillacea MUCL 33604 TaxID=933084 RepID=A0A067Q8I3_9AGAM|nr:hypothetical protein JAAARDRAFT_168979 [Jaapia argillacea MUCL 33604]
MSSRVVICGAGFLGSNIAKGLAIGVPGSATSHRIQISSRRPEKIHASLVPIIGEKHLLPPVAADITKPETLGPAFSEADVVVSLVGIMSGTPADYERIQWRGAENVAKAAKDAGAKLIHISAIGADPNSSIPYARTKALGEAAVFEANPEATIIRPSLVFGPGDGFFLRFANLSKYLPFLPVFGGGTSRFQPVFAGDIARLVEIISRRDSDVMKMTDGKIIEAGGPDIMTYRDIMKIVLYYTKRRRPIISLPFFVGKTQGFFLEKLPENLFTVTRDQVEQLKSDNVVNPCPPENHASFEDVIRKYSSSPLKSVHDILPTYIGP